MKREEVAMLIGAQIRVMDARDRAKSARAVLNKLARVCSEEGARSDDATRAILRAIARALRTISRMDVSPAAKQMDDAMNILRRLISDGANSLDEKKGGS